MTLHIIIVINDKIVLFTDCAIGQYVISVHVFARDRI